MPARFAAALAAAMLLAAPAFAQDSPYKGQTVRFLSARNVHQTAIGDKMAEIAKQWGIDFQARYITTDQLEKKVVVDFVGGADTWDLVYTGGIQRMYEWADGGIVVDMAPLIKKLADPKKLAWDDFTPSAQNAVSHKGRVLGLAVATSDQTLTYRKDLFEHPAEKAAFKAKYGYDLAPPATYVQVRDMAEFFTRKKGATLAGKVQDQDFYGSVFANKKGTFLWHRFENVLLAFGADIYDPATGRAGLADPPAIAAASFYKSMVPFLPPGHINMSSAESTVVFTSGRTAFMVEYFDRVVGQMEKEGKAVGIENVGYALPPSVEGNPRGRMNAFRSGPAVISMFGRARNPEAAYKLLEAATTAEAQLDMARKHVGYMPTKAPALQQLIAEQPVTAYLLRVADPKVAAMTDADIMPYPSILKASEIGNALSEAMSAILIGGQVEPEMKKAQAALEKAFAELKKQ